MAGKKEALFPLGDQVYSVTPLQESTYRYNTSTGRPIFRLCCLSQVVFRLNANGVPKSKIELSSFCTSRMFDASCLIPLHLELVLATLADWVG